MYKDIFDRLDSKNGEKDIYRLAQIKEEKTRDLGTIRCIKDYKYKVLVKDEDIKERWREYFDRLFNGNYTQNVGDLTIPLEDLNRNFMCRIRPCKVKKVVSNED